MHYTESPKVTMRSIPLEPKLTPPLLRRFHANMAVLPMAGRSIDYSTTSTSTSRNVCDVYNSSILKSSNNLCRILKYT